MGVPACSCVWLSAAVEHCRSTAQLSLHAAIWGRSAGLAQIKAVACCPHGQRMLLAAIAAATPLPPLARINIQSHYSPHSCPPLCASRAFSYLLQDIQRELRATQQQRELTEAEAAQLAAVNTRLSAENATLASTAAHLTAGCLWLQAHSD